jgi:4-amino-4-deoxy-L-arabinose transferase-like glycosyltransferase
LAVAAARLAYGTGLDEQVNAAVRRAPSTILTLYALVLGLPGIGRIPPVDRDEAYFAQAARQMLESGDF